MELRQLRAAHGPLHARSLVSTDSELLWIESTRREDVAAELLPEDTLRALFTVDPVATHGIHPTIKTDITVWLARGPHHIHDTITRRKGLMDEVFPWKPETLIRNTANALVAIHSIRHEDHPGLALPTLPPGSRMPHWWGDSFQAECSRNFESLRGMLKTTSSGSDAAGCERRLLHGRAKLSFIEVNSADPVVRFLGWREARWGDPVVDVATVVGDLCEVAVTGTPDARGLAKTFLGSYREAGGHDWLNLTRLREGVANAIAAHGAAYLAWRGPSEPYSPVEGHCVAAFEACQQILNESGA